MSLSQRPFAETAEALVIGLAKAGDTEAFAELVARQQSWIRNLMRRCCNNPTLADDLSQQVFLQAWKDIGRLRQVSSFQGWLRRLAMNTWRQHQRRNDPLKGAETPEDNTAAPGQHTALAMDLDQALATLSASERECLILSYHEGLSHAEIAELTGFPLGTVKSHISRGAKHLKLLLADYVNTPQTEREDVSDE
ncbi:MAG: RNA polymerase sigma factor [bacterium]